MCGKGASGAAVAPDWLPPWRRLAGLPSRATFAFGASGARAGAMAEDGEGRAGGWAGLGWAVGRAAGSSHLRWWAEGGGGSEEGITSWGSLRWVRGRKKREAAVRCGQSAALPRRSCAPKRCGST